MFKKFAILIVLATLLAGCATPSGVSSQPVPQPIEVPSNQTKATVVPGGSTVQTSEGKMIQVPSPVAVPTPPVLQEEKDGLQVYYLYQPINWKEAGIAVMPIGATIGVLDSPAPGPADVLGLVVWGNVTIAYVLYTALVPTGAIYFEDPMDLSSILALCSAEVSLMEVSTACVIS